MTDIPTNAPVGTSTVVRAAPPVRAKSSGIYNSILITQRVPMSIVYIGDNIKQTLEKKIAFDIEGKCIVEGFVKPGSNSSPGGLHLPR